MSFKVLEKNNIDNTNINGASFNKFVAGQKDGILKGILNECKITNPVSNVIMVDTGEFIISGFRVINEISVGFTMGTIPSEITNYSIIAEIVVDAESEVNFRLFLQQSSIEIAKQPLFDKSSGEGTYQAKVASFDFGPSGAISNIVRHFEILDNDYRTYINQQITEKTIPEAPQDDKTYGRKNKAWVTITGGGSGGGIPEAPLDGEPYLRKGGDWVEGVARKERISVANNYGEVEIKRTLNPNNTPDTFEIIFDKGGISQYMQYGAFKVNAFGRTYFSTDKFYYPRNISFKDVEITASDWSSDAEFAALDFNYSADIPISVDAYFEPNIDFSNYEPHIIFAPTESTGGNFAGFAKTLWKSSSPYYFIRIYAKEVPLATITLPLVKVMEV